MSVPIQNSFQMSHCSQFLKLKDALGAVRPQCSPFCPWMPCATWGLGLKTKKHPHKLSSTTATFWNQIFQVSRRTWSRNTAPDSSAFSPVTRHKNYCALCQCTNCYKGVDSTEEGQTVYLGSPSTCLDPHFPFLALLHCTKKKSLSLLLGQTSYNIHGMKLCFSRMEKYVKNAWVSGPDKMLKGWNSKC